MVQLRWEGIEMKRKFRRKAGGNREWTYIHVCSTSARTTELTPYLCDQYLQYRLLSRGCHAPFNRGNRLLGWYI
jgi:hypothetical protein